MPVSWLRMSAFGRQTPQLDRSRARHACNCDPPFAQRGGRRLGSGCYSDEPKAEANICSCDGGYRKGVAERQSQSLSHDVAGTMISVLVRFTRLSRSKLSVVWGFRQTTRTLVPPSILKGSRRTWFVGLGRVVASEGLLSWQRKGQRAEPR